MPVVYQDEQDDVVVRSTLLEAATATPDTGDDYVWFLDASDGDFKKCLIADLPTGGGGGGGAPTNAEYIVADLDGTLSNERLATNGTTITWDFSVSGAATAKRAALTGDVTASADSNSTTIASNAVTYAKMQDIVTDSLIGRDTAATGDPEAISVGGGVEFTGSAGIQRSALTGDVTASAGSASTTIAANAVTDTKLRDSAALSVIGRTANSSGDPADIAASAGGAGVLRESGSTIGFGTVATAGIANDAVTFAKIQNVTTDRLLGRDTAGSGDTEELTVGGGVEFTGSTGIQRSALTGDVTASAGSNATTIANDAVTDAKLRNSAALSLIGRSANSSGDPADISTTAGSNLVLLETGSTIAFGKVATGGLTANAVDDSIIRQGAALTVIGRSANSTGNVADIAASAASGAVLRESGSTIGFGTIASAGIATAAVTRAKLSDGTALSVIGRSANSTGVPADIAATAATDAVLRESGSVLGFGTVATGGIANDAVTDAKLRNGGALSVIGRSANSSGDPADISASAASGAVLRESGSTIGFGTIATAGIAANAVTDAKLRQGAACTVIGRSANSTGDVADISAGSNNQILQRVSNALTWTAAPANLDLSATTNDLGGLSAAKGRLFMIFGQFTSVGNQTVVTTNIGDLNMDSAQTVFPVACKVVGVGVNIQHQTASDPGNWDVVVLNDTASTNTTKSCTMTNLANANNITQGAMGSNLAFAAGDRFRLYMSGATANAPRAHITVFFVTT